jgi:3-dehydroquinate synthase
MDAIEQPLHLTFSYPVVFTSGVFAPANTVLRDVLGPATADGRARLLFVLDAGLVDAWPGLAGAVERYCAHHADRLALAAPPLIVPGGEVSKNAPQYLEQVQAAINAARLCRHSHVVAVGGGAVLDMAGYAAATAHRGIRLIRIPTTVLAQDDSAVGVKNGINACGKKNYLGTFTPPFAVINDIAFLLTLSDRDWRSGISEAVKVALIRDPAFFDRIEADAGALANRDEAAMARLVRRSAELHLLHVTTGGDPFELGSSRPLDFGHWAAHKLEQMTAHRLRHGEAVAIGIALDTTYAFLQGFLSEADWRRILGVLLAVGFDLSVPELSQALDDPEAGVLGGLEEFREHLGGSLTIMLLNGIGRPFDVHEIDRDVMIRSIELIARAHRESRVPAVTRKAS